MASSGTRQEHYQAGREEGGREPPKAPWPTVFALTELTAAEEARIAALVKKAVS